MVTVQWDDPKTSSSHLTGYQVTLRWQRYEAPNQLSGVPNSQIVTVGNNVTEYTFSNVQPYAQHCVQVEAVYSDDRVMLDTRTSRAPCFNTSTAGKHYPFIWKCVTCCTVRELAMRSFFCLIVFVSY